MMGTYIPKETPNAECMADLAAVFPLRRFVIDEYETKVSRRELCEPYFGVVVVFVSYEQPCIRVTYGWVDGLGADDVQCAQKRVHVGSFGHIAGGSPLSVLFEKLESRVAQRITEGLLRKPEWGSNG